MPRIDDELLPTYGPQGLDAVAVNVSRETGYAARVAREKELSFPVVLDIESEVFRLYRVPGSVFPLNVVIGRDGTIVHVDNESSIDAAAAAVAEALGG